MPIGQMIKWMSEKGFGFIKPSDGGADIFCHSSDLIHGDGSVERGDDVQFEIGYDDRAGKDRAINVELAEGGGRKPRSRSRSRSRGHGGGSGKPGTGTMLRWQEGKGFGFIKPDNGDEDLFCHVSNLLDGDGSVQDGDMVEFVEKINDRNGKPCATRVKLARGGGGGRSRRARDDSRDYDRRDRGGGRRHDYDDGYDRGRRGGGRSGGHDRHDRPSRRGRDDGYDDHYDDRPRRRERDDSRRR